MPQQSSRSQILGNVLFRWWALRKGKKFLPVERYHTKLESLHRMCVKVGWRKLGAVVDGEIVQTNTEIKKAAARYTRSGIECSHYDEASGEDGDYPTVWQGGDPVHPDDR